MHLWKKDIPDSATPKKRRPVMTKKTYAPHPIDTSTIELPDELLRLGEYLAKNTHDVWAQQRIGEDGRMEK